jgi:glycosyltransferase involved in cell wall biosynthesis
MISPSGKKILFLGHEASRTGAPIFLLHLIRWLRANTAYQCELFLTRGGELEAEFAAAVPTTNLTSLFRNSLPERLRSAFAQNLSAGERWQAKIRRRVAQVQPDLIYANTVAVTHEIGACAGLNIPIVWNVHEGPFVMNEFNGEGEFDNVRDAVARFIAASGIVKTGLLAKGVPSEKMEMIHEFVPPHLSAASNGDSSRQELRRDAGWPMDAFVVGMCGTVNWIKGVDYFIATARQVAASFPDRKIYFAWLGGGRDGLEDRHLKFDLRQCGLESRVHFFPPRPASTAFMAGLDVFFLSSREDVFPLAMLEAAAARLPVICFENSGGGPEFVENDAGQVVPHGDVAAAARALVQLQAEPERRLRLGVAAQQKVVTRFSIDGQAAKIAAVMEHQLSRNPCA